MKKHLRLIFLLLLLGLSDIALKAQTAFASEEELKKQAVKLFEEEAFEKAYPLYSQLTSIYPKDPNYNYRIGVCMLYAIDDKEQPISYLEFASNKSGVDKEVLFYLAKAYHLNYRFDDAIKSYQAYKKVASGAKAEKLQVDHQIEMCKSGKKLLHNLTDLIVLDKKEMSRADFFRAYDISDIGGKLLVKPDEDQFKTALDLKKKENSIIYLASNNNQIYFSSYGDNPDRGKDIFIIRKLPNGEWSKPQTLGHPINTEYDEDFPFLHPNGKVLYFCSKGHNSMGGYDIFKTTLNEETDTWNKPVNMDFPINTPDDDILYVTNENEKEAFFASARSSPTGKTVVYHIKSDRKTIDKAFIKGALVKNRQVQGMDIKITVKDMRDNSILGIYNSKTDGGYFISLPNGGNFLYTVEAADFTTQSELVEIPIQSTLTPLKQEISYELGTDKLIVKNLFDNTNNDDTGYLEVLSLIKQKSKMEVNINEDIVDNTSTDIVDTTTTSSTNTTVTTATEKITTLSNADIIKIAYDDSKDADAEAKEAREQADIALTLANQKNELAQSKSDEAKKLLAVVATITDDTQKQATINQANALNKEAEALNDETVVAFNLVKKLEKSAATKQEESELSQKYAKDLETAVKAKNSMDALTKLDDQKQKLETFSQEKTGVDDIFSSLKTDADNKQRELNKVVQTSTDIKQEIADNILLIDNVQADADKTKNEQLKKGLLDQIIELKQENVDKQKELEQNELKIVRVQKELNGIKNETDLVNAVIDRSKTETNETAAASIASIDKNKLEQQVSTIKTEITTTTPTTDITTNTINTIDTATTIVNNTAISNPTKEEEGETLIKVNQKYNDALLAAEKIENPADKEEVKAEVLKTWSEAINTEIEKQKEKFITVTDVETKNQLTNSIKDAEQLFKEKQAQANESLVKVETLKQQEKTLQTTSITTSSDTTTKKVTDTITNIAVANDTIVNKILANNTNPTDTLINTTTNTVITAITNTQVDTTTNTIVNTTTNTILTTTNTPTDTTTKTIANVTTSTVVNTITHTSSPIVDTLALVKLNEKFNDDLAKAEKIENVPDRESAKADVLKLWSEAINTQVNKQQQDLITTTDPETKTLLANSIRDAQKLLKEKQTQTNESLAKVETYKQENTIAVTTTTTIAADTTKQHAAIVSVQPIVYSTLSANEQITQANVLTKQANELDSQANELKTKAKSITDSTNKNAALSQIIELNKQAENKKTEAAEIIATANKTEFTTNQTQLKQLTQSAATNTSEDISMAKITVDEAGVYFDNAQKLRTEAASADSYFLKDSMLKKAYINEVLALEKQKKASDIYEKHRNDIVASVINNTTATSTITTSDNLTNTTKNATTNIKDTLIATPAPAVVINSITKDSQAKTTTASVIPDTIIHNTSLTKIPTSTPTNSTASTNANQQSAILLENNEKFERKTLPVYSLVKPIPVNEKLPEGLIFKVQIGAFRNPIPQDLFKGMTPITGETTPKGFTRYTAGIFVKFATADKVKNEIRDLGYKDAFVVAFLNGKRIPINEALTMVNIAPSTNTQTSTTPNTTTISVRTNTATTNTTVSNNPTSKPVNSVIAPTQNISVINGLFYTIQVGVYSQPVTVNKLYNIQPLYSETMPNGTLRYNTGIYNNLPRAIEAKNILIDVGIKDAFIIAYYNGKRISMTEAAVVSKQNEGVFSTASNVNKLPTFDSNNQQLATNNYQPTTINQQPSTVKQNNTIPIDSNIVFKVQIGAFKDEVPITIANKFLKIASKGIKNYKDENSLTIYTVGNYRTYEEANKVKSEVVAEGVTDAFIIAYKNGKKITVDEAKQLLNK